MRLRRALQFFGTAVLASAALSVANLVWIGLSDAGPIRGVTPIIAGIAIFWTVSLPFVLVGGLTVGLPVHLFLQKAGWCSWHQYLVAGFVAGMLAGVVLGSLFLMTTSVAIPLAFYGATAGVCAALIWWKLAVGRRRGERL